MNLEVHGIQSRAKKQKYDRGEWSLTQLEWV